MSRSVTDTDRCSLALAQRARLAGGKLVFDELLDAPQQSWRTHPHGWRNAPKAGLAVMRPEGAVVPGNRRVKLQLMPLFLERRRMREGFHSPFFFFFPLPTVSACCISMRSADRRNFLLRLFSTDVTGRRKGTLKPTEV